MLTQLASETRTRAGASVLAPLYRPFTTLLGVRRIPLYPPVEGQRPIQRTLCKFHRKVWPYTRCLSLSVQKRLAQTSSKSVDPTTMSGSQLRADVICELDTLAERLLTLPPAQSTGSAGWVVPLTPEETDFVNMGQVPQPLGCDVLALIDISLGEAPVKHPGVGPMGTGVHVPLLAMVGSTEPAVPCYPIQSLFGGIAQRVAAKVQGVVAAQRKALDKDDEGAVREGLQQLQTDAAASLIAVVVPPDGRRDLAIPLAMALFRLAIAEGNGSEEVKQ